jgi:Flp pilus assembly protein TadB
MKPRIVRTTLILGVAGSILLWIWRGWSWGGGFAGGAVLSAINFQWMHSAIGALADMTVSQTRAAAVLNATPSNDPSTEMVEAERSQPPKVGSGGAVGRFVLRYALIALVGYVIFRSSVLSLPAFFAGLFVAIAAVLAEIAYQLRRDFRGPRIYG